MADKIVVIGGGGHAMDVISTIRKNNGYEIIGYTDLFDKGKLLGVNYLGTDDILEDILKEYKNCNAAIGFGNIEISNRRQLIFDKLKKMGFNLPPIISSNAIINEEVFIDEGSIVMDGAIINVYSKIGKCAIINFGAIIGHNSIIGDFVHVSGGAIIAGGVDVGANCVVGIGARIIQGKKIVSDCLLGAGSVTIKDILKPGTYFGVPSRRMNIE
ncbi:MAG: acetyltransferase [Ignavibacterium sp.]|nr:acetyltransferase [Ignavibacterium sp.]